MRRPLRNAILALLAAPGAANIAAAQTPEAQIAAVKQQIRQAPMFDFGKVRPDDPVEHVFEFRNPGTETLEVKNIQLTPPLTVTKMSRRVMPGEAAAVTVRLGQPRKQG